MPSRVLIYSKNVARMADFYVRHFGYAATPDADGRIVELVHSERACTIMLHQAATSQRAGQSTVKLVFDVKDVPAFARAAMARGLKFGIVHQADGYQFANAKDPDGNSVSVSSRSFRD